MLLEKTGAGTWIAVTPDGDIKRIDLNVVVRIPLERRSQFPRPQAPYVYAFDPIPRENLDSYHRRARTMANLFNDAGVAVVSDVVLDNHTGTQHFEMMSGFAWTS